MLSESAKGQGNRYQVGIRHSVTISDGILGLIVTESSQANHLSASIAEIE